MTYGYGTTSRRIVCVYFCLRIFLIRLYYCKYCNVSSIQRKTIFFTALTHENTIIFFFKQDELINICKELMSINSYKKCIINLLIFISMVARVIFHTEVNAI